MANLDWFPDQKSEPGSVIIVARIDFGLSEDEIQRITRGPDAAGWDPFEAALLRAVDELNTNTSISNSTWSALAAHYNSEQLIDFVFTVGEYKLVSMALNTLGVQLEEGFEGFPQ